ncbi:YdiU family protein [Paenibacillus sp. KS-LC4]|uniref:protein adenylyltransferase SelO n=1 Tax=Paenibacillus sp. KS-LC4 TaxID=2979727 RepID=UPI0030D15198
MSEKQANIHIGWSFDNSYARLPEALFTATSPTSVRKPELIICNDRLAEALGLGAEALRSEEGVAMLAGNLIPEGALPLAQAYAGHQFGHFNRLGDGRALLLGEQMTPSGERVDIQLKGAGRTPYSRGGDGRAGVGPMLREYIISEAMQGLGIPTTRSLAVVKTGEPVYREDTQQGAILTRVAASHIRVGTFQFAAQWAAAEELRALADYTVQRHFPQIAADDNRYLSLLQEVIKRQASLIAKWQLVGFIHGVMNTDNMAISGETIDYGPCAFMDAFSLSTVFSSIDSQGRYAYGNQPYIAVWNLARLAESLLPLLHDEEEQALKLAEKALADFTDLYHRHWLSGMRGKLGIFNEEEQDDELMKGLLTLMETHGADYTNTFVALTFNRPDDSALFSSPEYTEWHKRWQNRLSRQEQSVEEVGQLMRSSNPAIIPRNHRVEEALEAAINGDYTVMERLLEALADPYAHSPKQADYAALPEPSGRAYRTYCGT